MTIGQMLIVLCAASSALAGALYFQFEAAGNLLVRIGKSIAAMLVAFFFVAVLPQWVLGMVGSKIGTRYADIPDAELMIAVAIGNVVFWIVLWRRIILR